MTHFEIQHDPWDQLRSLTPARIALGRAGGSLPTRELLDFGLAHARARDAVQCELDLPLLEQQLQGLGVGTATFNSAAENRLEYLRRPDRGRRLTPESRDQLQALAAQSGKSDLVIIVSDGLSALAAQRQTPLLLKALLPLLQCDNWRLAPLLLVRRARVAIQDEIGELLGAEIALILLGERPGLRAPDSLGAYLVYNPRIGATDAQRNCVSNIRPEGLGPADAAEILYSLLTESRRHKLSGIGLKAKRPAIPAGGVESTPASQQGL